MARPTRTERRARRELQAQSASAAPPRPRPVARAAGDGGDATEPQRRIPGHGVRTFLIESWGELRKVDWPGQNQVVQGTVVVLVACIIVGFYLWLNDLAWRHVIQDVLLR